LLKLKKAKNIPGDKRNGKPAGRMRKERKAGQGESKKEAEFFSASCNGRL